MTVPRTTSSRWNADASAVRCALCRENKPVDQFYIALRYRRPYPVSYCKACYAKRGDDPAHREAERDRVRRYRAGRNGR